MLSNEYTIKSFYGNVSVAATVLSYYLSNLSSYCCNEVSRVISSCVSESYNGDYDCDLFSVYPMCKKDFSVKCKSVYKANTLYVLVSDILRELKNITKASKLYHRIFDVVCNFDDGDLQKIGDECKGLNGDVKSTDYVKKIEGSSAQIASLSARVLSNLLIKYSADSNLEELLAEHDAICFEYITELIMNDLLMFNNSIPVASKYMIAKNLTINYIAYLRDEMSNVEDATSVESVLYAVEQAGLLKRVRTCRYIIAKCETSENNTLLTSRLLQM